MERTLISDLHQYVGKETTVMGWIDVRRDHGKLIFFDLRDRSGSLQVVAIPQNGVIETASQLRGQWVVAIRGKINKRPEKMVNPDSPYGDIELEALEITILSKAAELPFELGADLNLDTYLDNFPYAVRSQRGRDILAMQSSILEAYRNSLHAQGFTEFVAPAIVGGDAEGGAAVFKINYHYDQPAFLATSPQLYKQILVGAFERTCTIAKVFRAEKSATTRHLSEITQMDFEMGFVQDHRDVMAVLERAVKDTVRAVEEQHGEVFARFNTSVPLIPEKFPSLTLHEALEILGASKADDIEPEQERQICAWAKENHQSDFVFITAYPTQGRAFYTYEDPAEAPLSRGFDLLFRGLEINSGAQRIHDYDMLIQRIKDRRMDPKKFQYYLQAFKYGMPPHGGSSTGLERFTARMLDIPNVKEATAFPRDMNRIDTLLSE